MLRRLGRALSSIAARLSERGDVAAVVLFGSYARGEYGRKSDVDLLVLFEGASNPELDGRGAAVAQIVSETEAAERLPMNIVPLVASVDRPEDLAEGMKHALWTDGIVLYARAAALARFRAGALAPAAVVSYSSKGASPAERVALSRRLHGSGRRSGALGPRSRVLGPGSLLVAAEDIAAVRDALDEAGALYDTIPVWREV